MNHQCVLKTSNTVKAQQAVRAIRNEIKEKVVTGGECLNMVDNYVIEKYSENQDESKIIRAKARAKEFYEADDLPSMLELQIYCLKQTYTSTSDFERTVANPRQLPFQQYYYPNMPTQLPILQQQYFPGHQ
uniref:Uncharacterized protein n=1 Tax=Panagrolaimus davidi TaxID=227884 RepID=A0A914PJI7_9BILA